MKQLEDLSLTQSQREALEILSTQLRQQFHAIQVILFGSVARNEADEESDIDILVITSRSFTRAERHEITDRVCEINLEYNTNFSTLVVDRESWENGPLSVLLLHDTVLEEGIVI